MWLRLVEAGFKFPEPFKVKADDGITDLYGVMYKPFDFDPSKKYPIIAYVYPGPQTESVTKTFTPKGKRRPWPTGLHRHRGRQSRRQPAPLEVVSHLRLRQSARLRPGRQEGGHRAAGAQVSVHRHRPRRHLRATRAAASCPRRRCSSTRTSSRWRCPNPATTRTTSTTDVEREAPRRQGSGDDKDGNVKFEYKIEKNSEIAKNLKGHLHAVDRRYRQQRPPGQHLRLADALIKANKRFDFFILPGPAPRLRADGGLLLLGARRLLREVPARRFRPERRYVGVEPGAAGSACRRGVAPPGRGAQGRRGGN